MPSMASIVFKLWVAYMVLCLAHMSATFVSILVVWGLLLARNSRSTTVGPGPRSVIAVSSEMLGLGVTLAQGHARISVSHLAV